MIRASERPLGRARALLSTYYAHMLEYRAELFLWALAGSLPFILMGVWVQAAQSGRFPLQDVEFARYFLAVFVVRQLTVVWVVWEFESLVVEGRLSPLLLQPLDPVWRHLAGHTSERLVRLPFVAVLVALFFLLYPRALWVPELKSLGLTAVVVVLAFALRFTMQYSFAMFAFWTERAASIEELWMLITLFLSGMVAPLEVFPEPLRELVLWTPFPYLVAVPAQLLMGKLELFPRAVLTMSAWLALYLLFNRWLWRRGLRSYTAMGA